MLFLGIISTGFASVMFNRLIRERGPLFAGMSNNLVPVGAVIAGWLDAEPVSLLQTVALGGVVAMVAIVQIASRPPSYQTSEVRGTASNEGCILEEDLAR
jgi:drug/metabolite transporter (DMT)-like permease